jgi:hypothetical protein
MAWRASSGISGTAWFYRYGSAKTKPLEHRAQREVATGIEVRSDQITSGRFRHGAKLVR